MSWIYKAHLLLLWCDHSMKLMKLGVIYWNPLCMWNMWLKYQSNITYYYEKRPFFPGYGLHYTLFLISNTFFQLSLVCCLTFSWIELKMLLRCCLTYNHYYTDIHLYLLYLCPCRGPGLFMSYIFSLAFIVINHKTSFFRTSIILGWYREWKKRKTANVQPQGVA